MYLRQYVTFLDYHALDLKDSLRASEGDAFCCLALDMVGDSPLLQATYCYH